MAQQLSSDFAGRVPASVLLDAGGNYPHAPVAQAGIMQQALLQHGGVVELRVFEGRGHGSGSNEGYVDENTMVLDFFDR